MSLILCLTSLVQAQHYITEVRHLSIEEGLSDRYVHTVIQDSKGFIWIGTSYGLNRYDGYNVKWYTKEKDGLVGNYVSAIYEDAGGLLWVLHKEEREERTTSLKFSVFDPLTEQCYQLEDVLSEALLKETITNIVGTEKNRLFMSTASGNIYSYTKKQSIQQVLKIDPKDGLADVCQLDDQTYYLQTLNGNLIHYKENNTTVVKYPSLSFFRFFKHKGQVYGGGYALESYSSRAKYQFFSIKDGQRGLLKDYFEEEKENHHFMAYPLSFWNDEEQWVRMMHRTQNYVELFSAAGEPIYTSPAFLAGEYIDCFFIDNNGVIWLGTDKGIYLVEIHKNGFQQYLSNMQADEFQANYSTRGICATQDAIYVGGYGPPTKIHRKNDSLEHLVQLEQIAADFYGEPVNIIAIMESKDGTIWFSDNQYGLYQYHPSSEIFQRYSYPEHPNHVQKNKSPNPSLIWTLLEDKTGRIWLGLGNGLAYLDKDAGVIRLYPKMSISLAQSTVYSIQEDAYASEAQLWLGTTSGLYQLRFEEGVVGHYHPDGKKAHFLPHETILHFYQAAVDEFWLGTKGGGLVYWKTSNATHEQLTVENGMPHNIIYGVYPDDNNNLWLATKRGLACFNKQTRLINTYMPRDGLSDAEFNRTSHYKDKNGWLYFGGVNGINVFNPNKIARKLSQEAPVVVTNFQRLNQSKGDYINYTSEFRKNQTIHLSKDESAFYLEFALLDYINPNSTSYAYQIEGIHSDWIYQKENFIRLSTLPYGSYQLKLKAQGQNGDWIHLKNAIAIVYPKPFYLQWWFIGTVLLGLFGVVVVVIKQRFKRLRVAKIQLEREVQKRTIQIQKDKNIIAYQAKELQALNALKDRFFTNISHDFRTPLTLILGPINRLLKRNSYPPEETQTTLEGMKKNSQQLLELINEILDLSQLEEGKIELKEVAIDLYPFLEQILMRFRPIALHRGIDLQLNYSLDRKLWVLLDAEKVKKIINNLLSNAFKFTPLDGTIQLLVEQQQGQLMIQVEDSGEGIPDKDLPHVFDRFFQSNQANKKGKGGTGIGLALSLELALLMNGTLTVKNADSKGAVFTLNLPYKETTTQVEGQRTTVVPSSTALTSPIKPLPDATILIVEDNEEMQAFIMQVIGNYYTPILAGNGKEALEILANPAQRVDLILSDIMMPIMNGFELLNALKSTTAYRHIPTIMLTARVALKDKLEALRIGVDDYLTKPFDLDELLIRVNNLLQNSKERQDWHNAELLKTTTTKEEGQSSAIAIPVMTEEDQNWLKDVEHIIERECGNNNFTIDWLAGILAISARQLQRRLKKMTGLTPKKYITEVRLQTARSFLENKKYNTVNQVMHAVGFKKQSYFSKLFEERFGVLPSRFYE